MQSSLLLKKLTEAIQFQKKKKKKIKEKKIINKLFALQLLQTEKLNLTLGDEKCIWEGI